MTFDKSVPPQGWCVVRVDRVGAVRLGRQRSPDKHTGEHTTRYLRAANIKPAGLDVTDILEMDFTQAERAVFSLRVGDILLTEASGSSSQVGRAVLWRDEVPGCCYQNTIIRFRPHAALPDYALVVFRHYAASGVFGRVARGVGIQHLGASRFAELEFPLPPLAEQKRIAEAVGTRLTEIRQAESHLRAAIDGLDAQRNEVLAIAISGDLVASSDGAKGASDQASRTVVPIDPKLAAQRALFDQDSPLPDSLDGALEHLPLGWKWIRVDQAGDVRIGRQRSPDKHTGEHSTKYLRAANITPEGLDLTDVREMDFTPMEREVLALHSGDILMTEASGSASEVGRATIWRGEISMCCFQNTIIRFRPRAVIPEYALLVFRHYAACGILARIARGIGIQHIGASRLARLQFPLPPIDEQKRIAEAADKRLGELREAAIHLHSALGRLPEMERELLAAAVAGELTSQVPEEESAAHMLQRLGSPPEDTTPSPASKGDRKEKGRTVKSKDLLSGKAAKSKVQLRALLQKAGRPLPLPELFALAGFNRDEPEQVELFYLALRAELGRTIKQTGNDIENAMLEAITDAA